MRHEGLRGRGSVGAEGRSVGWDSTETADVVGNLAQEQKVCWKMGFRFVGGSSEDLPQRISEKPSIMPSWVCGLLCRVRCGSGA